MELRFGIGGHLDYVKIIVNNESQLYTFAHLQRAWQRYFSMMKNAHLWAFSKRKGVK
jgi:hypothetical protein